MTIHQSVLELVGDTPIVQAQRLDTGLCTLYLKLESQNPGGSIKDRIGLCDDRGRREARRHQARRHPGRRHRRQHRHRPGIGRPAEGLPADPRGPGQDEPGKDLQPQGDGRAGRAHPLRRGQGPSRLLPGHGRAHRARDPGRLLHQPVRQSGQPGRARIRHRPGTAAPARRQVCARGARQPGALHLPAPRHPDDQMRSSARGSSSPRWPSLASA